MSRPTGVWLPPSPPPHKCVLPEITSFVRDGDRWECDCGKMYVVYTESQHGEYWRAFRQIPNPRFSE